MSFFENFSEKLTTKGKEATAVAKKVAEIANLKNKISGIDVEIKKNYRKIGEAYFETYKDAEVTCEFEEYVQAIRDAKKAIIELNKKVRELKGAIECISCGSQIDATSNFCPRCGARVETESFEEETEEAEDIIIVNVANEEAEDIAEEIVEEAEDIIVVNIANETVEETVENILEEAVEIAEEKIEE